MDCKNEERILNLDKTLPHPPPLPVHIKSSMFHKKGLMMSGPKITRCCYVPNAVNNSWDRLFDEAYRTDVKVLTDDGGVIYAHASVLGVASPVLKGMLKRSKAKGRNHHRSISIRGVARDAVRVFIRYLYSSCYEEEDMNAFSLPLLVLSHVYVVPQLKRLCECWLEHRLMSIENAIDVFQLSLLCDASRLSLISHRFILSNFEAISVSEGWKAMKQSHPVLEKEIRKSKIDEDFRRKVRKRKANDRKTYEQLYEVMEALVHICTDGCQTIGPHDKILRDDREPCRYGACKGLEALIRHFAGCKMRGPGGCGHCKRMLQILELHSWLCANSDDCRVPLCRNFRQRRRKQMKKEDIRWRILVKKIVRSKNITGAPFFSLESRYLSSD